MSTIPAGEIKKRGVNAFEEVLEKGSEAVITVRGEQRYVVMTLAEYHRLHEADLAQAVREARADYKAGRIADKDLKAHLKRLDNEA